MIINNTLPEFSKLRNRFPFLCSVSIGSENCDYGDDIFKSSNGYHVFESFDIHDCLYCDDHGGSSNNDVDCRFGVNGTGNCESIDYIDSSNCYYSQSFARCYNLMYCFYCVDSHDCFGCSNLHNKSFCIFNIQHSEEEYKEKLPELINMSKEEVLAKRMGVIKKLPQLHSEHFDNINSEYCDYTYFCKDCYYCFDCARDENCGYLVASYDCKDTWDSDYVVRAEQCSECIHSGDIYNSYGLADCDHCFDSYFLEDCSNCSNCFGCAKLDNKKYCIFNVQYTKEEYPQKLAEVKKQYGINFQTA